MYAHARTRANPRGRAAHSRRKPIASERGVDTGEVDDRRSAAMKRLSNGQRATLDRLIGELDVLWIDLVSAAEGYNKKIAEAKEFCAGVAAEADEYRGARSDKWRESEVGAAHEEWSDAWREIELEEAPEVDNASDVLGSLDEEPSS